MIIGRNGKCVYLWWRQVNREGPWQTYESSKTITMQPEICSQPGDIAYLLQQLPSQETKSISIKTHPGKDAPPPFSWGERWTEIADDSLGLSCWQVLLACIHLTHKSGADWVHEEARSGESQEGPNMIDPIEFGLKLSRVNRIIFLSLDSTEEPLTKSMQVGQKEPSKHLFFPPNVWQLTQCSLLATTWEC